MKKKSPIRSRVAVPQQFKHSTIHNGDRESVAGRFPGYPKRPAASGKANIEKKVPKGRVPLAAKVKATEGCEIPKDRAECLGN